MSASVPPLQLAVFGDPIAHSRSPELHRHFAAATGLNIDYRRIRSSAAELPRKLQAFRAAGGVGANITVPLKQTVMALCSQLQPAAQRAAAVNTLCHDGDGWIGDNTDGIGLVQDLQDKDIKLRAARVLIIGAGGATRGIVPALLDAGCARIVIANRSLDKAQALVAGGNDDRLAASELKHDYRERFDLLIHATAAAHQQSTLPLPELLQGQPCCYDLSYGEASKAFTHWATMQDCVHHDGLGMLVAQAAASFQLWTGQTIGLDLRRTLIQRLQQ